MTDIKVLEKPRLRNPVLLVGLPGIGNIGRVGVGYLVTELKARSSPSFIQSISSRS
jgi:proteasome assembly chaperone (PAC2) family protein